MLPQLNPPHLHFIELTLHTWGKGLSVQQLVPGFKLQP